MDTQQQQTQQPGPFWVTAPREQFTETCRAQYFDHMVGSYGDRVLPSARFSFDTEAPVSAKGKR